MECSPTIQVGWGVGEKYDVALPLPPPPNTSHRNHHYYYISIERKGYGVNYNY